MINRILFWYVMVSHLIFIFLLPMVFFFTQYQYAAGSLESKTEILAAETSRFISRNPEMWTYEELRLKELLVSHPGLPETKRRILDKNSQAVAEDGVAPSPPVMIRVSHLLDSGVRVGRIEAILSLRPLLVKAAGVALLWGIFSGSSLLLFHVFLFLRTREAENEVLSIRQRLNEILEFIPDATFVIDQDKNVIAWNHAIEELSGVKREDILGKGNYEYSLPFTGERRPVLIDFLEVSVAALEPHYQGISRKNEKISAETSLTVNGRNLQIWGVAAPLYYKDGRRFGTIEVIKDITERKQAEERLRETNRCLSEETTRANALAIQAATASAAKSQFLANMSHEIRTPLNGVVGMTALLLDTELSEEQRRGTEIIRASGEALLGVINDILDFSKIEAGKLELETLDFDLQDFLADFTEFMALRAHDKDLAFCCTIHPDVPVFLRGDPGRLRQILINLAGNAVKFTHSGEISVRVLVESEDEAGVKLGFLVRDTGVGIPRDKIDLLFEKFTQADLSTTRKYGGTGLGLAISRQLVHMMDGEIGVESEEGHGSEFRFSVRFQQQCGRKQKSLPVPADRRNARVLIMSHVPENREFLAKHLAHWDMRPAMASCDQEALGLLRSAKQKADPFSIVLLAMPVPEADVEAFGKAIRTDPSLAKPRLILLTPLRLGIDARHYQEIGFSALLSMPPRRQELVNSLSLTLTTLTSTSSPAHLSDSASSLPPPANFQHRLQARVLLVDDNPINQQVGLTILKRLGIHGDSAENGLQAVEILETGGYDLVLMDVQMPVMDGFEATRRIRKLSSGNPSVPIIAVTAHAMRGDQEKCLEAGMNDYLAKPIEPQALIRILEKWLSPEQPESPRPGPVLAPVPTPVRLPANAQSSSGEEVAFDRKGFLNRLMGDEAFAASIITSFLADMPVQLRILKECIGRGDPVLAGQHAHKIKGAAIAVGAKSLGEAAFEVENAGRQGDFPACQAGLTKVEEQYQRFLKALPGNWVKPAGFNAEAPFENPT
jgi:signal transduction histidine kinase/CheY-like chemotaxis protein/HPt (histidine-containing phosphotransfer) domain-containing protein